MINILKNILKNENSDKKKEDTKNLELLSGLMIESAYTDGQIDDNEINKIKLSLIDIFEENPHDVDMVLNEAIRNKNNSKSLHYYTSFINKNFSEERKLLLIEVLWEIVLSDGKIHDYESNLIRRLAGLLYISDVNSGNARKKALHKLK